MGVPKWVDCEKCFNKDTVWCMSCKTKYETALYLNYTDKGVIITDTTITQNTIR